MAQRLDAQTVTKDEERAAIHMAASCAEQMAQLAMASDLAKSVFYSIQKYRPFMIPDLRSKNMAET